MSVTFAERKLHTIELLTKLESEEMLLLIEELLRAEEGVDWAEHLSDQELTDIQEGINDLDAGKSEDYEDFMHRMERKFS